MNVVGIELRTSGDILEIHAVAFPVSKNFFPLVSVRTGEKAVLTDASLLMQWRDDSGSYDFTNLDAYLTKNKIHRRAAPPEPVKAVAPDDGSPNNQPSP